MINLEMLNNLKIGNVVTCVEIYDGEIYLGRIDEVNMKTGICTPKDKSGIEITITRLNVERNKRNKNNGCEYCNGKKDIFYLGGGIMQGDKYLSIKDDKLIVIEEYRNEPVHSFDIKFCPVCGKKL